MESAKISKDNLSLASFKIDGVPIEQDDKLIFAWAVLDLYSYGGVSNLPAPADIFDILEGFADGDLTSKHRLFEIMKACRYLASVCVNKDTEDLALVPAICEKIIYLANEESFQFLYLMFTKAILYGPYLGCKPFQEKNLEIEILCSKDSVSRYLIWAI